MSATGIIDHVVRPHVAVTEDKYLRQPASATESFLPSNMPMGVARIVTNILALFEARTMAEHCRPMPIMSRDVVWDAPPFLLRCGGVGGWMHGAGSSQMHPTYIMPQSAMWFVGAPL